MAVILAGMAALALTNTDPRPSTETAALSRQLFEYGAVRFIHHRAPAPDPLFAKVEAGVTLTATESCAYRKAYWQVVAENRGTFKLLDQNIHFATNFGSAHGNNCGETGIPGLHDLHDISALQNLHDIRAGIGQIHTVGALRRILAANDMNKDLTDLVVHFAPATHSIGVEDQGFLDRAEDRISVLYARLRDGFKAAQFAEINSCAYWAGVDQALQAHVDLVQLAQEAQIAGMSAWERRLAGRWLSMQTVAPTLDVTAPLRPRPAQCPVPSF